MKALIIDDDLLKFCDEKRALQALKINDITCFPALESGMKALRSQHFDLLILDTSFPDENAGRPVPNTGNMVLGYMKQERINTPVIITSTMVGDYSNEPLVLGVAKYESNAQDLISQYKAILREHNIKVK